MRRVAAILFAVLIFPLPGTSQLPPPASGQSIPAQIDINGNLLPVARYGNPLNLPSGAKLNGTDLQTTLNGKQPLDSDLTAIAALGTTSFGRSFLTLADAAASRTYIGAGTSSFSGLFTGLDFTSSNLTSLATRNFSDLQNIPNFGAYTYLIRLVGGVPTAFDARGIQISSNADTGALVNALMPTLSVNPTGAVFEFDRAAFPFATAITHNTPTIKDDFGNVTQLAPVVIRGAGANVAADSTEPLKQLNTIFYPTSSFSPSGGYLVNVNASATGSRAVRSFAMEGIAIVSTTNGAATNQSDSPPYGVAASKSAGVSIINPGAGYLRNVSVGSPHGNGISVTTTDTGSGVGSAFRVFDCFVNAVQGSGHYAFIVTLDDCELSHSFAYFTSAGSTDFKIGSGASQPVRLTGCDSNANNGGTVLELAGSASVNGLTTHGDGVWPANWIKKTGTGNVSIAGSVFQNARPSASGGTVVYQLSGSSGGSVIIAGCSFSGLDVGSTLVKQASNADPTESLYFGPNDIQVTSDPVIYTSGGFTQYAAGQLRYGPFNSNSTPLFGLVRTNGNLIANYQSTGPGNAQLAFDSDRNTNLTFRHSGVDKWYVGNDYTNDRYRWNDGTNEVASLFQAGGMSINNSGYNPGLGNLSLGGLTASQFIETDANKVLVSKTASQFRTDILPTQSSQSGKYLTTNGTDVSWATVASGGGDMLAANNLSDLANKATARQNLGTYFSKHVAKSANFSVASTDAGTVFDVTTGANPITVTLDTAANLGTNFQCLIRKVDSGVGTVTANSQQIGKLNHWIEVDSDGTTVRSKTIQGGFDASGNYTLSSPGSITLSPGAGSTLGSNWTWNGVAIANSYLATTLSSKTLDDTNSYTAKDGSFTLENITTVSKKAVFDLSNISTSTTRTVNIPDANSTTAQAKSAVSNQFLTAMSAQGVFTSAQPAIANLSDTGTLATWAGTTPASGVMTFLGTPSSANLATAVTDETGSGKLVFATSPSITTGINDANGNSMLAFTATASAVDGFTFTNAATANPATVTMAATGSDSNVSLQLTPKGTGVVIVNGGVISPASGDIKLRPGSSGNVRFEKNDGTLESYVETTTGGFVIQNNSGLFRFGGGDSGFERVGAGALRVINGTTAQLGSLSMGVRDGGTTTVTNGLTIGHQSTGTPAAGLGSGILLNINSSTTADQNAAQIAALWTDATHATRTSDVTISTVNSAAALAEKFRVVGAGGISWNGGAVFKKVLTATATLDFPSTAAGVSNDLTITVTGAALGDVVSIGVPDGSTGAHSDYSAWVSATDTVKVRFLNGGATLDPASGTFRAQVNQF